MSKTRNKLSIALCGLLAVAMIGGTLAIFTDRESGSMEAEIGTLDLVFTDISASKSGTNNLTSPNEAAIDKSWDNHALLPEGGTIKPDDYFDVSYKLSNAGNMAMDVRQRIILTSTEPMEYYIDDNSLFEDDAGTTGTQLVNQGFYLIDSNGDALNGTLSADGLTITYDLPDTVLNGTGENGEIAGISNISWDHKTASENNLKIEELGYVHVSNQTPSKDEMLTATFTVYSVDGDIIDSYIHPEGVAKFLTEDLLVVGQFLVVYENNVVYQGITFPKAGIYAAPGYAPPEAAGVVSISFPSASSETITQPLGLKFVKKNNDFQGAGVSLELQAQAKQHANTDDSDWSEWVTLATN